ncbi:MAG: hypothetical protein WD042_05635 [Phycisphaeraceae bacterium]
MREILRGYLSLMLMAALLAGCAGPAPMHEGALGHPDVVEALPAGGDDGPLFSLVSATGIVRYVEGRDAGKDYEFQVARGQVGWTIRVQDKCVTYFVPSPQGLLIAREDDIKENVRVDYEPALLALPTGLSADKPYEGRAKVRIVNLTTGVQREEGDVTYRVELLGVQEVKTPAGTFRATLLRTTRHMDLALADVKVVITTAFDSELGEVAERVEQTTTALEVFETTDVFERRLVESSEE